jgi:hypothetical protein
MSRKLTNIPNPNKISNEELVFLQDTSRDELKKSATISNDSKSYKGRMISMSDGFFEKLNAYLKKYPTEGNRSSFIVRIISDYIDSKNDRNS